MLGAGCGARQHPEHALQRANDSHGQVVQGPDSLLTRVCAWVHRTHVLNIHLFVRALIT